MNTKTKKWIGLVLTGLLALTFTSSAVFKIMGPENVVKGFQDLGLDSSLLLPIGIIELLCAVLFVIPRTGILGTVLLIGYIGGTIMAHLPSGMPIYTNVLIGIVIGITGWIRFPELGQRLFYPDTIPSE
jgi:hypothetical protein